MSSYLLDLDLLIGVTAVHHGLTLLTRNVRHLARVPGVKIHEYEAQARD